MYETFYGFRAKPFQLSPDPEFFFASREHRRAAAFVEYGMHQGEGFIVVTGEVGAGKTTIIRNLLAKLDPARVSSANLVSTQVDAEDTLRLAAASFGVGVSGLCKADLLLAIEAHLTSEALQGRRCLLIVDEAQNLTPRAVEELRMLSNFQLEAKPLLQTFLVGQPEFRHILQRPQMHPLRQRVIAACHIGPLLADDTRSYVEHRLRLVGWQGDPQLPDEAFAAIHEESGGVPRRINLVCDRALLAGFLGDRHEITGDEFRAVAAELRAETFPPLPEEAGTESTMPPDNAPQEARETPGGETIDLLDREIREVKAALGRVERSNEATQSMMRRFLEWIRHEPGSRGGHD